MFSISSFVKFINFWYVRISTFLKYSSLAFSDRPFICSSIWSPIPVLGTRYFIFLSLLSYINCNAINDFPVPVACTIPTLFDFSKSFTTFIYAFKLCFLNIPSFINFSYSSWFISISPFVLLILYQILNY